MENYLVGFIVLIIFWLWIRSLHLGKVFVIKISPGKVLVKKGSPPKKFIEDCKQVIRRQVVRGYIYGCEEDTGFSLRFSSTIESTAQQKFRNIFPFEQYSSKRIIVDPDSDRPKVRAK